MWIYYLITAFSVMVGHVGGRTMDDTDLKVQTQAGRSVVLPCTVYELNNGMVIWQDPRDLLLFLNGTRQPTTDSRIKLSSPFINDWNLHINNVKYNDRGAYRCSVTGSTSHRIVTLVVQVSAVIKEDMTSKDTQEVEGSNVTLTCDATGIPEPSIKWQFKSFDGKIEPNIWNDSVLTINNIDRQQAGVYKCMAYNTVGLPAIKEIKVQVEYPPEVKVSQSKIKQSLGKGTMLECLVNAYPQEEVYWTKDNIIFQTTWEYKVSLYNVDDRSLVLSLEITNIQMVDFGTYKCVAKNSHGVAEAIVVLEENKPPTTTTTKKTTPSTTTLVTTTVESTLTSTDATTKVDVMSTVTTSGADSTTTTTTAYESTSGSKQTFKPLNTANPLQPGYDTINKTDGNNGGYRDSSSSLTVLLSIFVTLLLMDNKKATVLSMMFVILCMHVSVENM